MSDCDHRVCRKLAGCAYRWQPPSAIRTSNCPNCGVWLQNGQNDHNRVVHGENRDRLVAS